MRFISILVTLVSLLGSAVTVAAYVTGEPNLCGVYSRMGVRLCRAAPADLDHSTWLHNGSTLYLVADGADRKLYYRSPRQGMIAAGARPDSLLFSGTADGDRWQGIAYIFSKHCGNIAYAVKGRANDKRIEMEGATPIRDQDCHLVRQGGSVANDTLVFERVN